MGLSLEQIYRTITTNPNRINASELARRLFPDFVQDEKIGQALISGVGTFQYTHPKTRFTINQEITVIGTEKGSRHNRPVNYNYGMLTSKEYGHIPEILKKSVAEKRPVFSIIDTPGADPRQPEMGHVISDCITAYLSAEIPLISLILGEGGSGGAVALWVADYSMMMENAIFSVIKPESCGAILFKDTTRIKDSLEILKPFPDEMLRKGIIQSIVPERAEIPDYSVLEKEPKQFKRVDLDKAETQYFDAFAGLVKSAFGKALEEIYNSVCFGNKSESSLHRQYGRQNFSIDEILENRDRMLEIRYERIMNYGIGLQKDSKRQRASYFVRRHNPLHKRKPTVSKKLTTFMKEQLDDLQRACLEQHNKLEDGLNVECHRIINLGEDNTKDIGCKSSGTIPRSFAYMQYEDNFKACPFCQTPLEHLASDEWLTCLNVTNIREVNKEMKLNHLIPKHFIRGDYGKDIDEIIDIYDIYDSLSTYIGDITKYRVALAISEYDFIVGTMGVVLGEKFRRLADLAITYHIPLINISCAGGARMQEGILSLMQMPKTNLVVKQFKENNLPYICILSNPTTGGTLASYASQGSVTIAEPAALISFAGPKVVRLAGLAYDEQNFLSEEHEKAGRVMVHPRWKMANVVISNLKQFYDTDARYKEMCDKIKERQEIGSS